MKVIVHVEKNPESNAALQALYSRSPKSVVEQAEKLSRNNFSGSFMERVFIGYGHESVGELGYTTIYFEGVSFLAEKAIQDFNLYVGQACSSRYIDFSTQKFVNPYDIKDHIHPDAPKNKGAIDEVHQLLREFYTDSQDPLFDHLAKQFPNPDPDNAEATSVWIKTIKARAFDVLRGFLPAGATTNVSWTVNLRNANQRLILLSHHPLEEVRTMARKAYIALYAEYPHSFKKEYYELFQEFENAKDKGQWVLAGMNHLQLEGDAFAALCDVHHFYDADACLNDYKLHWANAAEGYFNIAGLDDLWLDTENGEGNRLKKVPLPRHARLWHKQLEIDFDIDFGSYRDVQRHRNGYCNMPVLEPDYGVETWYRDMLPPDLQVKADALMGKIEKICSEALYVGLNLTSDDTFSLKGDDPRVKIVRSRKYALQYAMPLAVIVSVNYDCNLGQAVYLSELRSGKTVHPTLRVPAQRIAQALMDAGIEMYADMGETEWSLKRGTQDIRTTDDDGDLTKSL